MSTFAKYYRWSDHDRRAGPFIYARDHRGYRPFAVVLSSGGDEKDGDCCTLRFSAFGHTLVVAMPRIIGPWRQWVDTSKYDWDTSPDGGYWDVHSREYGFSLSNSGAIGDPLFLQLFLGAQTHDSRTEKTWCKFLPWTEWRHVRHSFYGLEGEHVATIPDTGRSYLDDPDRFERERAIGDATPTVSFSFKDFDGEELSARTRIEEREWRFGAGWFKWLSLFRKPLIRRDLDIWFSGETGDRKGSWKGGTIGHSITMLPGELHEAAFKRYCAEHDMTFVGAAE